MSLRMNIYGWCQLDFLQVLGSKDAALLEKASSLISHALPGEPARSQALAWLHTLVESGYPLRQAREPSSNAVGDLLTVKMETEAHVFANFCLARAIASDGHLDLASVSSHWSQPAVGKLYRELASCGFTKSSECCVQYFSWMSGLSSGTTLFGDDFRSDWSFYTVFSNSDLAAIIPVFNAAAAFQRTLPEGIPDEYARTMVTCLSDESKLFVQDLVNWFAQIQQAGQDAFILWW